MVVVVAPRWRSEEDLVIQAPAVPLEKYGAGRFSWFGASEVEQPPQP
jgi:hypothetical protein